MHGLCSILEVFEIFTKSIQAQDYPTMNVMALFYSEILDSLQKMDLFTEDVVLIEAISILKQNLSKRFPVTDVMIASAMLDPRMNGLPLIKEYLSDNGMFLCPVINYILNLILYILNCFFLLHGILNRYYRIAVDSKNCKRSSYRSLKLR